ncbi:DUF4021 domain-containing protein [Aquibacillus salsiterrae]|uniref:DUF4021 family protein n=1 Tax=Aquibacillus salsiterrae TaxID=2950439 RepID=A0A9X4ADE8_9BACI|nr:DUF4021 domain-containing protein [Aquibacillus salsiterrae]MDC3415297.1 DUF4021 family protein [Aquibacillus salsiterrae]
MTKRKNSTSKSQLAKAEERLGLDPDEQAMNGAYGMVETKEEDRANKKS